MTKLSYKGCRFPPEIIHQAIWLYFRFTLSFRDVEDLLAERGIADPTIVMTVRRSCLPIFLAQLARLRAAQHRTFALNISASPEPARCARASHQGQHHRPSTSPPCGRIGRD